MNYGKTGDHTYGLDKAKHLPVAILSTFHALGLWYAIKEKTSILLPLAAILGLALGIIVGAASDNLSSIVNSSAEAFINGYSYGAPLLIFLVLAPVLSRILSTRRRGRFGLYVVSWLAATKILAMLWAVLFTVVVFRLPLISEHSVSVGSALAQTSRSLLSTLTVSQFFWAIYAAIAIGFVAIKVKRLASLLEKGVSTIEYAGQYIQPLIPLFMFTVGVYVQALPQQLEDQIGLEGSAASFAVLNILGFNMDPNTTTGMVMAYIVGALLVAVACFAWHFAILALAKYRESRFSLEDYFERLLY